MDTKKQNSNITVIIPIHKALDKKEAEYLENAIKSIPEGCKVILSVYNPDKLEKTIPGLLQLKVPEDAQIIVCDKTDFQYIVNKGVSGVDTEWFTILEFDDTMTDISLVNFWKYQEYNEKFNFFMFINDLYQVKEDDTVEFAGNGNAEPWASSFSDVLGVIDEKCIDGYFNYYPCGTIMRTSTYREIGGLKEGIKLMFWYEFMLRAVRNGELFYVIPRIGYIHLIGRKGSMYDISLKEFTKEEASFWFNTAKKESYFKEDRHPEYVPKVNVDDYGPEEEETEK